MRIALILSSNLWFSPYVRYYTSVLDWLDIKHELIVWNRFGTTEAGVKAYNLASPLNRSLLGKMVDSYRYSRFVRSQLKRERYDRLVVFTLQNALMLYPMLKKKYRGRYVVDIRDYSVAQRLMGWRLPGVVQDAAMAVVSSSGFRAWLPKGVAYCIQHNTETYHPQPMQAVIEGQTRYRILTIGAIGYFDANRTLIESLADDPMFEVAFVGSGYAEQMLKDFVGSSGIKNVIFQGRYAKQDEPKLLHGASLLSILMDDSINSKTLMSNRFYLSLIYGIPMMVDAGTEQARWVEKYNLGLIIDKKQDLKQQIIQFLQNFNRDKFESGRRVCLEIIRQDNAEFESQFNAFLRISPSPIKSEKFPKTKT